MGGGRLLIVNYSNVQVAAGMNTNRLTGATNSGGLHNTVYVIVVLFVDWLLLLINRMRTH